VAVAVAVAVVPPLRARAVALPAIAAALDLPAPRPLALDVSLGERTVAGVTVDRYGRDRAVDPTVVLVPGAARAGRDDPRVVRLAEALAASGRTVLVPELALYDLELVPADIGRIADVVAAAGASAPVVLVGISYGGSLALRAIADHPDLAPRVALAVVFGAYGDLVGVVQGAVTGTVRVGDESFPWEPEARAEELLRRELLDALPADLADAARAALDGERSLASLPEGARAAVELLTHDDPARTRDIVGRLPPALQQRLRAVSPSPVADCIRVPVRILHARNDPAVPYAEGVRLAAQLPQASLTTVERFDHVDLDVGSPRAVWQAVRDLSRVWRVTGAALAAQEPWLPGHVR
jgi:pimeloyl-ACP methyl ester carboxylesterase